MFLGRRPAYLSVRKVPSCSTLLWPVVTSPGDLWTMETWAPCPCVKICAVNHTNATWRLWRENAVSLFTATVRRSVCGCRPKTTSTCCNFLTSLVLTVFQSAVSHHKSHAPHYSRNSKCLSFSTSGFFSFAKNGEKSSLVALCKNLF